MAVLVKFLISAELENLAYGTNGIPFSTRDDPRFPTVRGVLRRGMTVEGLKQFIAAQVGVFF